MTTPPRNSASANRSPGKGRAAGKSAAAKTAAPETGTADADEKAAPKDAQPDAPSAAQSAAKTESPAAAPTAFAPPPPVRTAGAGSGGYAGADGPAAGWRGTDHRQLKRPASVRAVAANVPGSSASSAMRSGVIFARACDLA